MIDPERRLQAALALGWLASAGFALATAVSQLMLAAVNNDFGEFAHHPGPDDWYPVCLWLTVFLVLGVVTVLADAAWFRWGTAVLYGALALASASHTVGHLTDGDRSAYGLDLSLEIGQVALALALAGVALRWARLGGGRALARRPA